MSKSKKQNTHIAAILILSLAVLFSLSSNKIYAETTAEENIEISREMQEEIAPMPDEASEENMLISAPENIESEIGVEEILTAEETATLENEAKTLVEQDENITPESLGVKDQTTLPDQKFAYAFKNLWRGILTATTTNPIKKAELKIRFANERLIEAQKIAEKTGDFAKIETAIDKYKEEIEKAKEKIEKIEERNDKKADKLLEKIADNQIKHAILIDKIKNNLSEENQEKISDKIEEAKNKVLGDLSGAALEISDPEKFRERLQNAIENQSGSDFKQLKHLEILKRVEEQVPDNAKEAIQKVQEKTMERFQEKISEMKKEKVMALQGYVKNMSGDKIRQLEVVNDLEAVNTSDNAQKSIENAKNEATNQIKNILSGDQFKKEKAKITEQLKTGGMEKVRIINDLENVSSLENSEEIKTIKNAALENLKTKIENATPEEKQRILQKMGKTQDSKQLKAIDDLEKIMPENKKEILNGIKEKIQTNTGIANPASEFCIKKGGKLKIKKDVQNNEYGICVFSNGQECDEWKFFKGECKVENKQPKENGQTGANSTPGANTPEKINGLNQGRIENRVMDQNSSIAQ